MSDPTGSDNFRLGSCRISLKSFVLDSDRKLSDVGSDHRNIPESIRFDGLLQDFVSKVDTDRIMNAADDNVLFLT